MDRQEQTAFKDPHAILRAAVSDLITVGLDTFTQWLQRQPRNTVDYDDPRIVVDTAAHTEHSVVAAANVLGVSTDASADEVRAAFRAKVKERVAIGAFHDQRGSATDREAQELIDAKNLLIERSRKEQTHAA